jgi:hypothetical protein
MQLVALGRLWCILAGGWIGSIANGRRQYARQGCSLLLLRLLPLPRELDIVLIEYYFLDVMGRHLAHE